MLNLLAIGLCPDWLGFNHGYGAVKERKMTTKVRIDSQNVDNFFEIHIDEGGYTVLYIIDAASRAIEQTIELGTIHPIELRNRAVDMMVLSREMLSRESK